jgi:hypothetical protein
LTAGGTYFRSRETGLKANLISVQVLEYPATDTRPKTGFCVVTNYGQAVDEMVTGPVKADIFDMQLKSLDVIEVTDLHTSSARANYSISSKIAPAFAQAVQIACTWKNSLLVVPGYVAVKLTPGASGFAQTDVVTITPRIKVYELVAKTVTPDGGSGSAGIPGYIPPTTGGTGWDIDQLRANVNANDPWIEMMERTPQSTSDGGAGPAPPRAALNDVQDTGSDAEFLSPFVEARLHGGDGLPDDPGREITGPSRSLVLIAYGEDYHGKLTAINTMYEWAGESAREGGWKPY